jgi:PAS domain S-box-containing protein
MSQPGKRKTLLLVEDDLLIAMGCSMSLEGFGYEVLCANSGEKAFMMATADARVDLVLMDIDLGQGISGPEAAAMILGSRSIPIVFLTSHAEREMVELVRGITRYGYVIKNSGDFVLQSSIEMAFELFEAHCQMAERDEKYRLLAENVSDVLWIMDPLSGRLSFISPAGERLFGRCVDELLGLSLAEFTTPASFAEASAKIEFWLGRDREDMLANSLTTSDLELVRKDGSTVWTEIVTRFALDEAGGLILIGVTRDITQRRSAELALAESRALQVALADSTEDLIWSVEAEGFRLLAFNRAMLAHFRKTRGMELAVGMGIEDIFPPGDFVSRWRALYGRALHEGSYCTEYLIYNGTMLLQLNLNVLKREGTVFGISVFAKDITKARKAEAERIGESGAREGLGRRDELHRAVLMSAMDGYFLVDAMGRILEVNEAYCQMTGYSEGEILSMRISDIEAEGEAEETRARMARLREQGVDRFATRHRRRDGAVIDVEVSVQYRSQWGGFYAVFVRDITERRQAEERIQALLAEKNLILREVHHRIKNNFNTVHSLLQLQAGLSRNAEAVAELEDAGRRVRSMALLYGNIYESANYSAVSLSAYLPALVNEIVTNFPNAGSVKTRVRSDDFCLDVDRLQPLAIIINELLTNCMKYAFDASVGGLISVSVVLKGSAICLTIEDDGRGMPEGIDFGCSSGFGLSLVGGLAMQLGGEVRIHRGRGTRIVMEFPR